MFNVAYRFLWICLMFSGALARAAGIKIALAIGKGAVAEAKYTAAVGDVWCLPALSWILQIGVSVVTGVLVLISLLVFLRPSDLAGIFASDPEFIQVFLTSMTPVNQILLLDPHPPHTHREWQKPGYRWLSWSSP